MTKNLDKYWLAFASIEKIGSVFIKTLYEHFGSIEQAWHAHIEDLHQIETLTRRQINDFIECKKNVNPDKCLEIILNKNIKYLNYTNEKYPQLLKEIYNPPMTLFYKGNLDRCNFNRTLAVVGSRKASEAAKTVLTKIISGFKGTDICIVSGLALGIDSCAHKAAINNKISTIGVIASGFDFIYPTQNKDLYKKIEDEAGVIFSEYWPTFQPLQWRFPHRNRIVTGLSKGTLVAEAAMKSGALISANLCLEQNRELMCMPGLLTNPNTEGIYKLIKNGAAVITRPEDILETLNWQIEKQESTIGRNPESYIDELDLDETEQKVFISIATEAKNFDNILLETELDFGDLMVVLTNLEIKGYIKQTDGEKYMSVINVC